MFDSDSSNGDSVSSNEGTYRARRSRTSRTDKKHYPAPSKYYSFDCPFTLHKVDHIMFKSHFWIIGDIASINTQESAKTVYAQIIELHRNSVCENRAKVVWLAPKANIGVTDESKLVHHSHFKPNDFVHIESDTRLIPLECLTFIMHVPNEFEYKNRIGTECLVDQHIISHAERYADSDEDDGPKPKSKVRRLLNK